MTNLNTPYATLSFVNAFTPRPRVDGPAVYSCSLLFPPKEQKTPAYKALEEAAAEAWRKMFGATASMKGAMMPFKDASEKSYDGYLPGYTYISPWSKNKPGIVNAQREEILLPEEVWSGQLVRANVTPFAWSRSGKRGVSFGWNHLQIIKSAGCRRLDGRPSATDAFDDGVVDENGEDGPF
jgi:ssDNA-binding protein